MKGYVLRNIWSVLDGCFRQGALHGFKGQDSGFDVLKSVYRSLIYGIQSNIKAYIYQKLSYLIRNSQSQEDESLLIMREDLRFIYYFIYNILL